MSNLTPLLAGLGLTLGFASATFAGQVTFQVNLSAQVALGNFNPTSDSVVVAGDPINGWSTSFTGWWGLENRQDDDAGSTTFGSYVR